MSREEEIKSFALGQGFDMVRITSATGFLAVEQVITERINQGLMDGLPWYTVERLGYSCHPQRLLPTARSIIALAISYLPAQDPHLKARLRFYLAKSPGMPLEQIIIPSSAQS